MDHVLPPEEDADIPGFCRALGVPGLAESDSAVGETAPC